MLATVAAPVLAGIGYARMKERLEGRGVPARARCFLLVTVLAVLTANGSHASPAFARMEYQLKGYDAPRVAREGPLLQYPWRRLHALEAYESSQAMLTSRAAGSRRLLRVDADALPVPSPGRPGAPGKHAMQGSSWRP